MSKTVKLNNEELAHLKTMLFMRADDFRHLSVEELYEGGIYEWVNALDTLMAKLDPQFELGAVNRFISSKTNN